MKRLLSILIVLLFFPLITNAAVLFSDDFEWGADWHTSDGTTVPEANGWSDAYSQANRGGSYDASYVNAAGGKTGRGWIQYWDQATVGYAQDIWLNFPASIGNQNDIYIGYWFKIDPEWDWGSANRLKIFKLHFYPSDTTWDIYWGDWCASMPSGGNYPPAGEDFTICTDEYGLNTFGGWNSIADNDWHSFVWHINVTSGTLSLKIDNENAANTSNSTAFPAESTGVWQDGGDGVGGNISDGGGGKAEMWSAWDNFIIATTEAEVTTFLGSGTTLVPIATGCTLSGASMQ